MSMQNKIQVIASNGGHRKSELGARQSVLRTPVIARGFSPVAIRSSFKGEADSFTLCAQNDIQFSYCEYLWRTVMLSFTCHCEAV